MAHVCYGVVLQYYFCLKMTIVVYCIYAISLLSAMSVMPVVSL